MIRPSTEKALTLFSFVQIDQATLRIQNLRLLERRSLFRKGGYVYYSSYFSDLHRVIFLITNGNIRQSWYIIFPIAVLIPEPWFVLKALQWVEIVCVYIGYLDKNLHLGSLRYSKWKSFFQFFSDSKSLIPPCTHFTLLQETCQIVHT